MRALLEIKGLTMTTTRAKTDNAAPSTLNKFLEEAYKSKKRIYITYKKGFETDRGLHSEDGLTRYMQVGKDSKGNYLELPFARSKNPSNVLTDSKAVDSWGYKTQGVTIKPSKGKSKGQKKRWAGIATPTKPNSKVASIVEDRKPANKSSMFTINLSQIEFMTELKNLVGKQTPKVLNLLNNHGLVALS